MHTLPPPATASHRPSRTRFTFMSLAALALLWPALASAQHVHVNGGAESTAIGAPLTFVNGPNYNTNAAYDVYLSFTNAGPFANFYQGAGVTFTALPSTLDNGGPAFGHAADGAFLQLQIVSLSGPAGGVFSIWMQDAANPRDSHPLFALPSGATGRTNLLALSESDGSPGMDPYGHIHGRTFTATKPGLYTLGCRLVDTSTNGPARRPLHTPSAPSYFYFQAGLTLSAAPASGTTARLGFGTALGPTYFIESTPSLAEPEWTTVAGPFVGNNHVVPVDVPRPASPVFFRIRSQ